MGTAALKAQVDAIRKSVGALGSVYESLVRKLVEIEAEMAKGKAPREYIDIVFSPRPNAPGPEELVFVEVEDHTGASINIGEWTKSKGGLDALRIPWAKRGPALSDHERTAIEQTLRFLDEQAGKSHQGYYSTGWAGEKLRELLKRAG